MALASQLLTLVIVMSPVFLYSTRAQRTAEYDKLQSEVEELARDLPLTLEELGLTSVVQDAQELKTDVPSYEGGSGQVSPHWYQTGTITTLQYSGDQDARAFAFVTPELQRNADNAIPIQSTLVKLTADIEGFPARYPATTAEGMPNLVSDYRDLQASFQDPDIQEWFTSGTNTTRKLDQHFTIESHPGGLAYCPDGFLEKKPDGSTGFKEVASVTVFTFYKHSFIDVTFQAIIVLGNSDDSSVAACGLLAYGD
uniref:Uncharacterized protein n=1 Tax=Branchiostoma floridae TaxID=7739 RepID=C3Y9B5_BRAFL|eukprot:XP_002607161.1 hypothetical protein BRAFLDRAFT_68044 [Branchiostoma floridae]